MAVLHQAVNLVDHTQSMNQRSSFGADEGQSAKQLFRKDGADGLLGGDCRPAASGTKTAASHTRPDATKQTQSRPSSSRSESKATSESSSDRKALKGSIFTVHDRQRRKNKSAVVPVASGGPGREGVQGAPPVSSFTSQQGKAAGTAKHSGEDATQCSNNEKKSSIPVKTNARKEKLDWQRNNSSSKGTTSSPTSPHHAASTVSYKVLSVCPAPESQQANLSNTSETKLEQVEKHGRIAQLSFHATVGRKQPGAGLMELWATQNPSNWTAKDREIGDAQLHNVKPLHSVEEGRGGSDVLKGEGPGGRGLRIMSAWGGGSGKSPSTAEDTRTAHHTLDVNGGYDKDSFEEVSDTASDLPSTDGMEEEEEEEEEVEVFNRSDLAVSTSQTPPMKNASPLVVHDATAAGRGKTPLEEEEKGYHLTSTPLNSSSRDRLKVVQSTPTTPFSSDSAPSKTVGPTRVINVAPHQCSGYKYDMKCGEVVPPRDQLKLDLELTEIHFPASGVAPRGEVVKENEERTAGVETGGLSPIRASPDATLESLTNQSSHETSSPRSLQLQDTEALLEPGGGSQHSKQCAPILTAKTPLTSEGLSPLSVLLSPHLMSTRLLSEPLDRKGPSKPCLQTSCKNLAILSVLMKGKRSQSPPPYPKPAGGRALASPCPEYGTTQPRMDEVVRAQRGWGGKERQGAEERNNSPRDQKTEGRKLEGESSGGHSASLSSDSEDESADARQSKGQTTVLHTAARSGNVRLVQQYVRQGYNINAPDHNGWSPLMCCIHMEGVHLACADALIEAGANLDHTGNDDATALHTAAYTGNVSLVELLLLNGANPDVRDSWGRLPLHWATHPPSPKCLKIILKHACLGIDETDDCGMTCLMWAAYNNSPEVVKVLLDRGAEVEEKDVDGLTALHWAIHKEGTLCLRLLLTAERTFYKDRKGCTIMHRAAEHGALACGKMIWSVRPDAIYDCDKKGRTPLHWAAACSRVDYCAFLLEKGADASQRDYQDMTALDYARDKGLDYVVALMVCDDTAVMDFAKASRSTSVISRLNKSCVESIDTLTHTSPTLSGTDEAASTALAEEKLGGLSSPSAVTLGSLTSAKPGEDLSGYLGLFSQQGKGPLQHHFFWADNSRSNLCWCRDERYKRNHNTSRVLSVHRGPSQAVKCRLDYAPLDTHRHVFHVVLEDSVLDILCYGEKSYELWLSEIGGLAVGNILPKTSTSLESKTCTDVFSNISVTSAEFEV